MTLTKRIFRAVESILLLATIFVAFMSFYFQYAEGLEPCPLCLMQRWSIILIGMFLLMGLCLSTLQRAKIVLFFQAFFSMAGVYFSGRQLWLQSLSVDEVPACSPGLDLMLEYFPWHQILKVMFMGGGDCAENDWFWLGVPMPGWSLLYFLVLLFASCLLFVWAHRTKKHLLDT